MREDEVVKVAEGLSEAQRRAVLEEYPSDGDWRYSPRGQPRTHFALQDRGIIDAVTGLQGVVKGRLNEKGLAVRKYLERNDG